MTAREALTAPPPESARALAHTRRSFALAHALRSLALAAGLGFLSACGGADAGAGMNEVEARLAIDRLVLLFRPVDPTTTSDVQDRNFRERSAHLEALHAAGSAAGREALARLAQAGGEPFDVQWALLEAAAYNAPQETLPTLERLILSYDGKGEELRTQAVRIAAETVPQRAIELYEPMLREPLARQTRPPQEEVVRGWHTAAKKLGLTEARVLCDVVVDLRQPPDARYAAVNALADFGGDRATRALREVLVESASDGNIRRKSAQALLRIMPRSDFCALIKEASEHEADTVFLYFLADLLDKNCGGQ
jgi:HEAT repeat protein